MKKALDGKIFELTPDEVAAFQEIQSSWQADGQKRGIKQQIADIEATITPRRIREAILGSDNGWLNGVNAQIAQLRSRLG